MPGVRHVASILLLLAFLCLGSGTAEFLHNREHAREDAQSDHPAAPHDESNCVIHAQLHTPLLSIAWTPLLVFLGLFVAFLSLLTPALIPQRTFIRLDCRGPPAC